MPNVIGGGVMGGDEAVGRDCWGRGNFRGVERGSAGRKLKMMQPSSSQQVEHVLEFSTINMEDIILARGAMTSNLSQLVACALNKKL